MRTVSQEPGKKYIYNDQEETFRRRESMKNDLKSEKITKNNVV